MTSLSYYCHHIESIFYSNVLYFILMHYICIEITARETFIHSLLAFVGIETSIYIRFVVVLIALCLYPFIEGTKIFI